MTKTLYHFIVDFFVNNFFTWMECYTNSCHKISEYGIYKITNGEMLENGMSFRVAPAPLLFLILLLIVVADFDFNYVSVKDM